MNLIPPTHFFIFANIAELYYFSSSAIIVMVAATVGSAVAFLILAMREKNVTGMGLALSALLGFFLSFPLSGFLGPTGAVLVGAAAGFGTHMIHRSVGGNMLKLLTILASISAAVTIAVAAVFAAV